MSVLIKKSRHYLSGTTGVTWWQQDDKSLLEWHQILPIDTSQYSSLHFDSHLDHNGKLGRFMEQQSRRPFRPLLPETIERGTGRRLPGSSLADDRLIYAAAAHIQGLVTEDKMLSGVGSNCDPRPSTSYTLYYKRQSSGDSMHAGGESGDGVTTHHSMSTLDIHRSAVDSNSGAIPPSSSLLVYDPTKKLPGWTYKKLQEDVEAVEFKFLVEHDRLEREKCEALERLKRQIENAQKAWLKRDRPKTPDADFEETDSSTARRKTSDPLLYTRYSA